MRMQEWPPYIGAASENRVECDSVGGTYLAPADIFRAVGGTRLSLTPHRCPIVVDLLLAARFLVFPLAALTFSRDNRVRSPSMQHYA